jgi:ABC-2 type transport system ATP-binding protein
MLEIQQFLKKYPTGFQLKIEALHLEKGIHLIQGENGAGKSTLFKAIAGIQTFTGNILLDKVDLKKEPLVFRQWVNYAEAEPVYPDFLSLDDLILFVSKAKKALRMQIDELKEAFGVSTFSDNNITTYSSGMLKKTSLLLAFLGNPKLTILDEPFTTIDTGSQDFLVQLIEKKSAEGVSFLISTHQKAFIDILPFTTRHTISNGRMIQ